MPMAESCTFCYPEGSGKVKKWNKKSQDWDEVPCPVCQGKGVLTKKDRKK